MKTNVKELLRFLNVVGMTDEAEVKECVLDFTPKGIKIESITAQENVAIKGFYTVETNKTDLGKVGLDNLPILRKYLESFVTETVDITKKDNYLVLSTPKKKVKVQLRSTDYIPAVENEKIDKLIALGNKNVVTLQKGVLDKLLGNSTLLNTNEFTLKGKGKKLNYSAKSWTEDILEETLEAEGLDNVEVHLSKYFLNAVKNIGDDVQIGINPKTPIYVAYEKDKIKVEFAIAPIIKEE